MFRVITEEEELRIKEKWSPKASAINCSCIIILS
jgi:hypothetical protein